MVVDKGFTILLLNLPSPRGQTLWRDAAGGFGASISHSGDYRTDGDTPLHPFLPYASSVLLEAGYEFKVVDGQRHSAENDQILKCVEKINPSIIFSIISLPSMSSDLKILDKIKEALQNVIVVGVGAVCRVIPEEVLLKGKIDILLRNSYPYCNGMVELIEKLHKLGSLNSVKGISYFEDDHVVHTAELQELRFDDLPNPNYDFIPLDGYENFSGSTGMRIPYVLVIESKGCPFGCVYCPYPLGYGKELTFRSPTKIANEIEYLHHTRSINAFAFKGQTFAYSKKHAFEICDEIIKRKIDVSWVCESRVDEVNRELLEKMKSAGCKRIHYGVETGDAETLKIAKPGVMLHTTKKAFNLTREYGLATQSHVVLGWPDDTYDTLAKTRRFLLELNPDALNLNFLTPYPGTKMYEIAQKDSLLLTQDWSNFTSHKVVMKTRNLSADQLYAIRNKIVRDFSIFKLEQLLQHIDAKNINKPRTFFNTAKKLMNKALFPNIE